MNTTYNGWSNYETWNVSLWLNNDEAHYHAGLLPAMNSNSPVTALKQYVSDCAAETGSFGDLTIAQLFDVNWSELVDTNIE